MKSSTQTQTRTQGQKASNESMNLTGASNQPYLLDIDYESMAEEIRLISAPVSFKELKKFYNL